MASIIKIKRSSTTGAVPASLAVGEIAVNLFDRKLYVGNTTGVTAIGGEDFRLTTQNATGGAYLRLLGDSVLSTNNVLLRSGSGVTIDRESNGSIVISSSAVAGSIDTTAMADGAVTSPKIAAKTIQANNVADGAITSPLIASKTIQANNIADGAITSPLIAEKTIQANNIADGVITSTQIASKSISANSIADGTITATQLANQTVTANAIASQAVTAAKIDTNAVTTAKIADGAVTGAKLAAGTVASNAIALDAVTLGTQTTGNYVATIADSGSGKITVSGSGSETAAVTLTIASGAITATELGTGAVTNTKIAADAVTLGTQTTGNYVATITGTANQIAVSGSGSESAAVTLSLPADVTVNNDLTVTNDARVLGNLRVDGNLDVEGSVTYISSTTVNVEDSMLKLSANNASDTTDTGVYAKYVVSGNSAVQYTGYFRDATDGVFKFFSGLDAEPTTTVDTTDTGYGLAQVDAVIDGGTY